MAAASISAEDDLSCPICFELFVDPHTPKNLPSCGHVCCEVCLKKIAGGQQVCPECRQEIKIPTVGGITSFTTNFRLRSLAENHRRVGNNLLQNQMSHRKSGVPFCADHDEKMHYYCVTCNTLACQACLTLKHNGTEHNIEGVREMRRQQEVELKSVTTRVKSRIAKVERVLLDLKTAESQSTEIYQNVEKQIDIRTESQINTLRTKNRELKKEVEQAKQSYIAGLRRESSTGQKSVNSATVAFQSVVRAEKLPDCEYVTQHSKLVNKMEEIHIGLSKPTTFTANKAKQDIIKFVPSRPTSFANLGHIIYFNPGKVKTIKNTQTLDGFSTASRIESTSDGVLAITDFNGNKVVVYHKVSGKYENKLELKLVSENKYKPDGIATCPDGKFMVARHKCIEVYSPKGYHQKDIGIHGSWDMTVNRVQVTSDGKIFVGSYYVSRILEISPTGDVIRTIHTRIKPDHMILIHDTHIAISDWEAGKVIVIDIESGQETLCIGIKMARGVCYDEYTECLLVARNDVPCNGAIIPDYTGVIEQYSYTTGKLIACLQSELYHPGGMVLTSDGHLIVANDETVEVFEIR